MKHNSAKYDAFYTPTGNLWEKVVNLLLLLVFGERSDTKTYWEGKGNIHFLGDLCEEYWNQPQVTFLNYCLMFMRKEMLAFWQRKTYTKK